jgi:hypothetical protein
MTQSPFDPLALWRDMLTKWQAAFGESAGKGFAPAEMARFINQSMAMSMQMQQAVAMVMGKYLATLNIPTRADLAAMEARLERIEDQLARLTRQAADSVQKPGAPTRGAEPETPPRAKRAAPPRQPAASRAELAERTAAAPAAAQPARAAKPARRTAKKQTRAAS